MLSKVPFLNFVLGFNLRLLQQIRVSTEESSERINRYVIAPHKLMLEPYVERQRRPPEASQILGNVNHHDQSKRFTADWQIILRLVSEP